ncbi:MAG TPA: hypothetical protein VM536_20315 [Chloroflexia bacterium]|nr:hypothetical protein [Chloroflexia bacterium]
MESSRPASRTILVALVGSCLGLAALGVATLVVWVAILMARTVGWIAEHNRQAQIATAPLYTVPLYPGGIRDDASGLAVTGNGYRAFDITAPNSDVAAAWYTSTLSQPPWSVSHTSRREIDAQTVASTGKDHLVYNCIEAERQEPNGRKQRYYWTIFWTRQSNHTRVIVETPTDPTFSDCN